VRFLWSWRLVSQEAFVTRVLLYDLQSQTLFDFLLMKGHVMVIKVCAEEFFSFLLRLISTGSLAWHYLQTDDILKTLFKVGLLKRNDRICGSLYS
jgi:hypothetical protein